MTEAKPATSAASKLPDENAMKKLARLAAVQALYQIELTGRKPADILKQFRDRPGELLQETGMPVTASDMAMSVQEPDIDLMSGIVTGVMADLETIDGMISGALDPRFSTDRIEVLLRSILRCGVFELLQHPKIATGIIVNDYIDVAHAYFNAREPGLVNAVLDKLAKKLRS